MDRKILVYLFLSFSLVLGGLFRLYKLSSSPASLNWDEAALGYNAYSLLLTGRDEYGYVLPLSLRSFDDFKPAAYAYMTIPFVKLAGLSEITVRLTSVIAGLLTIVTLFIIATKLTNNRILSATAAFLVAIEPWAVQFSRPAFEANLSLLLVLITIAVLVRNRYPMAIFISTLNIFVYHSAKVYLLLIIFLIIIKTRKYILLSILAVVILGLQTWFGSGLARFGSTGISKLWNETHSIYKFSGEVVDRYFSYYSPVNLFVRGSNEPNQKLPSFALFYPFEFFLFVPGMIYVLRLKKSLTIWILLASVPAILTWSWFSPIRVLPLWAGVSIINALGLWWWTRKINSKIILPIFVLLISISVSLLGIDVWLRLPYLNYGDWQWGFRETLTAINPIQDKYKSIVWDTDQAQPHIFTLFYTKYSPIQYHLEVPFVPVPRTNFDFGKYHFRKIFWPDDREFKDTLFIGGVYSLPEDDLKRYNAKVYKEIIDPQGYIQSKIVPR